MNAATGNQSTKYLYEDPYNAALATNTIYPDSADTTSASVAAGCNICADGTALSLDFLARGSW